MAHLHDDAREMAPGYADAPNRRVTGANAVDYVYRDVGAGELPLVLLPHFRGNLDNWDPALIDALARRRRVVTFDNVGVGVTTGTTPSTVQAMAHDAITFLEALDLDRIDLLGFSLGSFGAQEVVLIRPDLVRRLVLASSTPRGADGMHGWAPDVIAAVGKPAPNPEGVLDVVYTRSAAGRQSGREAFARMFARTMGADEPTTWQTRQAQYDAVCDWGIPDHAALQRVSALPVLVANGDSDAMIRPRYSHLLAGLLPDARVAIHPDSAHGFVFQFHDECAAAVDAFLPQG
jgi:pimeloyl-ACP methyl ester carboxylesterase